MTAIFVLAVFVLASPGICGNVELSGIKEAALETSPLDVAVSEDMGMFFILTPGELLLFTTQDGQMVGRYPLEKQYDRLSYSERYNQVIMTDSVNKFLKVIEVEIIRNISTASRPFKGPEDAAVTVVVFTDYQCPYCARLDDLLEETVIKYPGKVKLVVKNYPLSSHPFAHKAARAALAAGNQGKYWEFHHELFNNFKEITDAKIEEIAQNLKLDMVKFKKDMDSTDMHERVAQDINHAKENGVSGTPTVFINGKLLKRKNPEDLHKKIEFEIKKSETAKQGQK
jgi:protein-disulfide isomerase